jgi:hypothetical protein
VQLRKARRAGRAPVLPESPQHRLWREAQAIAEREIDAARQALTEGLQHGLLLLQEPGQRFARTPGLSSVPSFSAAHGRWGLPATASGTGKSQMRISQTATTTATLATRSSRAAKENGCAPCEPEGATSGYGTSARRVETRTRRGGLCGVLVVVLLLVGAYAVPASQPLKGLRHSAAWLVGTAPGWGDQIGKAGPCLRDI